jgi:hypothetical protein
MSLDDSLTYERDRQDDVPVQSLGLGTRLLPKRLVRARRHPSKVDDWPPLDQV